MNDLIPTSPEPQPNGHALGLELVELLRTLARNTAATEPHPSPTLRTIVEWYESRIRVAKELLKGSRQSSWRATSRRPRPTECQCVPAFTMEEDTTEPAPLRARS